MARLYEHGRRRLTRWQARLTKLATLVRNPSYWPALRLGVGASVEHSSLPWSQGIATVIDVGANRGQFASLALVRFPRAQVYCFEPQVTAAAKLREVIRSLGGEHRANVFEVGVGAATGPRVFHVAKEDDSSSFLQMTSAQRREFGTHQLADVLLPVRRIDDVLRCSDLVAPVVMKIDVQGFELEVLRGSTGLLECVDDLLVECSFTDFYAGQAQSVDIITFVAARGFELVALKPSATRADGIVLQADLLFRRSERLLVREQT